MSKYRWHWVVWKAVKEPYPNPILTHFFFQAKRLSLGITLQLTKFWGYRFAWKTFLGTSLRWLLSQMIRDKEAAQRALRCSEVNTPGFSHQNLDKKQKNVVSSVIPQHFGKLPFQFNAVLGRNITEISCMESHSLVHVWGETRELEKYLLGTFWE